MRPIGLHVRVMETMVHAADYAAQLNIPLFQCFLVHQLDRQPLHIDHDMTQQFQSKMQDRRLYIHGSYWINLAQLSHKGIAVLQHEIEQTQKLGAQHIVLHPGAANGHPSHPEGINALARIINQIMSAEKNIVLMLENTAHAHQAIGSNLADFHILQQKLDSPERLRFCIDTAHAHAYGYDITSPEKQDAFIQLIDDTIGIKMVELIHLNDAIHPRGSRIDKHALLGEGTIGLAALKSFALHPRLVHVPLILELPSLPLEQDHAMLQLVRSWHL